MVSAESGVLGTVTLTRIAWGVGSGWWDSCHARDEHRQRLPWECVRELGASRTKVRPTGEGARRDHGGAPRGVRSARCPDTVNLQEHDGRENMKVWLADQEVEQLVEIASDVEHHLAIGLGVRCGLRSAEVLDVTSRDVQDTTAAGCCGFRMGRAGSIERRLCRRNSRRRSRP